MKKLNNKGFGILELLLLLLLLLILIFLFWWVWQQNQKNNDSNQPQGGVEVVQKAEDKKDKVVSVKYLEIPELSVKLKLNSDTDDAYYVMKNGYAYLSLTSLKDVDDCAADETGIAAVGKYKKTDVNEQTGKTYATEGTVIGNFAYTISQAQAYCTQKPTEQKTAEAARAAFPKLSILAL
jgi:hypothetical protein